VRHGLLGEQALTERQESGAPPIGQEPERADADKAARQNVEQEAAQELLRIERHPSLLIPVGIILPAKGNPVPVEGYEAVVGDGHAMGVAGEITQHMVGAAERWLGIDHPVLTEQGTQEGTECFFLLERLERTRERKLAQVKSALQTGDEALLSTAKRVERNVAQSVRGDCLSFTISRPYAHSQAMSIAMSLADDMSG
jgi:hypothetical protein